MIQSICVYCGSSDGYQADFKRIASELGQIMARRDLALVYGGGDSGLMGAVARGALGEGGRVTGVIPEFLLSREQAEGARGLDGATIEVVPDMHRRKHRMFELSDAFIALPGGIGTLEELVEMMTWSQLGRHKKPMGVLDVDGFWQPLMTLIAHMSDSGFLHNSDKAQLIVDSHSENLLDAISLSSDG